MRAVDGIELLGGPVQIVIDGMFREREDFGNFGAGFAGRRPVQAIDLAVGECIDNADVEIADLCEPIEDMGGNIEEILDLFAREKLAIAGQRNRSANA